MTAIQHVDLCRGAIAAVEMFNAFQTAAATLTRYANNYSIPSITAAAYFNQVESLRFWYRTPVDNLLAYLKLGNMNMKLAGRALNGNLQAVDQFLAMEIQARLPALAIGDSKVYDEFTHRMRRLVNGVSYTYPAAIDGIESEFGFHFENQPASSRVDETDRFCLYQVLPTDSKVKVKVRKDGKPIMIMPPFVLGPNILSFLPQENRSYAHAFANQGIPTYIRVLKNIQDNEAVQTMAPEDDVKDTRKFCETIKARHGLPLTLNGYCQGGFAALCYLLSGELDDLVDAFITCVAPMDGTRSTGLAKFLQDLPAVFNDLAYGTKTLPNGNKVADGSLMGWIYKLKSIETETPVLAMWRDMLLVSKGNGDPAAINKTAAALNYWLLYERNDLPMKITRMSFDSYTIPITKDGTLPIKLFGKPLNLKRLQEKKIPWLICYGKHDDLVEPKTALAPVNYVNAEVTGFPKGHVAIATSWSFPESEHALHLRYKEENTRGPVRFQMDLQEQIDQTRKPAPAKARKKAGAESAAKAAAAKKKTKPSGPAAQPSSKD
jgi:hypothetical protein